MQNKEAMMSDYERRREVSKAVDEFVQALINSGEDNPYAVHFALGTLQTLLIESLLGNSVNLEYIQ